MPADIPAKITLDMIREKLFSAVVCDALDGLGFTRQSPRIPLLPLTVDGVLAGRCKTTLWGEMSHPDPKPYELELKAVDSCAADDVIVCAAQGSMLSGIWGELLSTAARNSGCIGAIVDGAVRDVRKMSAMHFPVFARGTSPYDSKDRQRVVDFDVSLEIDNVCFAPGDLVIADRDGVVVVPRDVETAAITAAWVKVHDEDRTRAAIQAGMKAGDAYAKFGVL
jgi:regulator of RNase E activity RraA